MRLFIFIALLAFGADLLPDDGESDGRRGNALYEDGAYAEAADAFTAGLGVLSEDASLRLRYGLHNNLGAALLKSGDAAGALEALEQALGAASSDADLARTAYNAGNAAFASENLQAALEFYRRSLLRSPDNHDAKFNYEFVKRRLEQQHEEEDQQQQGDSDQSGEEQDDQNQQDSGDQNQDGEQQGGERNEQEDGGAEQEPQNGDSQEEESRPPAQSGEPSPNQLSSEQAERILQALQNEEEQLLRQVQRPASRPRRVEKDW